jgi:hypothetical protein
MNIRMAPADDKAQNKCLAIHNLPEHTTDRLAAMIGSYPISRLLRDLFPASPAPCELAQLEATALKSTSIGLVPTTGEPTCTLQEKPACKAHEALAKALNKVSFPHWYHIQRM